MDRAFKHYLNCLFTVPPPPSYNMWGWGEGDSHTSMFCCNITVLQCRSFQHSFHRFQTLRELWMLPMSLSLSLSLSLSPNYKTCLNTSPNTYWAFWQLKRPSHQLRTAMGFLLSRFEIDLDIFDELRNGRIHQIQVGIYFVAQKSHE